MQSMVADWPRRVLMTADTVGGVWMYAVELAHELVRRGVDVHIAAMGGPVKRCQREELPDVTLHEATWRLEWMHDCWADVRRAGEWLMQIESDARPDVVHLNQYAFGALPFCAPTLIVAHSCVLSWWHAVHGCPAPIDWDRYREAVERGLDGADLVVAPTAAMLGALKRHHGFDRGGVVIPNCRRAALYPPASKEPIIFAAGRLWDAAKNLEALESVAPSLRWRVRVAGSTAHPDGGIRRAVNVDLAGELAPHAMAEELGRASIYALPARYEPFGLSALEAGLCGCALVLGDIPSLREVWENAALYVPPDDHHALRGALQRLIADEPLRTDMGHRARMRALHYSPARMGQRYMLAYTRATRARASSRGARADPDVRRLACAS